MYRNESRTHRGDSLLSPDEVDARNSAEARHRLERFAQGVAIIDRQQGTVPEAAPAYHPDVDSQLSALAERFAAMNQRG